MYKDKDKQREADRERQRRDKKGVTEQGPTEGVTQPTCDQIVDVLHARILANPKVKLTPNQ